MLIFLLCTLETPNPQIQTLESLNPQPLNPQCTLAKDTTTSAGSPPPFWTSLIGIDDVPMLGIQQGREEAVPGIQRRERLRLRLCESCQGWFLSVHLEERGGV